MEILIGIIIGAVAMDFLWAWRMGIPQMFWQRIVNRFKGD